MFTDLNRVESHPPWLNTKTVAIIKAHGKCRDYCLQFLNDFYNFQFCVEFSLYKLLPVHHYDLPSPHYLLLSALYALRCAIYPLSSTSDSLRATLHNLTSSTIYDQLSEPICLEGIGIAIYIFFFFFFFQVSRFERCQHLKAVSNLIS